MKIEIELEVELPQLNKGFLCMPLRGCLIAWGYIQMILTIIYGIHLCVDWANRSSYAPFEWHFIKLFFFIWTLFDIVLCGFLILGSHKNNGNYLEVCYSYLRVKVPLYLAIILVSGFLQPMRYSHWWFERNADPWMMLLLYYSPAFGILVWVGQLYLMLLVNSMLVNLGHHNDFSTLFSRLGNKRIHYSDNLAENILQQSLKDEEVKKIDDVC